jgi:DNA-binding transcriptional LysR family regulator
LRLLPPPLAVPDISLFVAWHPRVDDDPAHAWFRGMLVRASKRAANA